MTYRAVDGSPIPGKLVASRYTGRGVRGDQVAASGEDGAGYGFASLDLPADAAKEYRFPLGAIPAGLTLFDISEDTSFSFVGDDGIYHVPFGVIENTTDLGDDEFVIRIGVTFSPAWAVGSNALIGAVL